MGLAARPAPESEELASLVKGLKLLDNSFLGSHHSYLEGPSIRTLHYGSYREVPFTPARHLMVKGEFNPWLRLLPGVRRGDWLYYNSAREDYRTFYAREREWGGGLLVTERLLAGSHSEAYDLTTRRRVAAQASLCVLAEVLVFHVRSVRPVDVVGRAGLHAAADPAVDLPEVPYEVRDGTFLFGGLLGWGRKNRRTYVQLLWIPIPAGNAVR